MENLTIPYFWLYKTCRQVVCFSFSKVGVLCNLSLPNNNSSCVIFMFHIKSMRGIFWSESRSIWMMSMFQG